MDEEVTESPTFPQTMPMRGKANIVPNYVEGIRMFEHAHWSRISFARGFFFLGDFDTHHSDTHSLKEKNFVTQV